MRWSPRPTPEGGLVGQRSMTAEGQDDGSMGTVIKHPAGARQLGGLCQPGLSRATVSSSCATSSACSVAGRAEERGPGDLPQALTG